jgi:feruloyl esterase
MAAALAHTMFGAVSSGTIKQTQQFARLFMAPGMWHCQAGPGPNSFGGMIQQPVPFDPQHDLLSALTQWVEKGVAPTSVIATKYLNDSPQAGIQMQRDELNDFNETPAPQYGP